MEGRKDILRVGRWVDGRKRREGKADDIWASFLSPDPVLTLDEGQWEVVGL